MEIIKLLESNGIRPSVLRTEVMRFLNENRTHPSVDMIYDALSPRIPTLSKTTIYNILNLFVEKGVIQDITIDPRQARYDFDISTHAHFLCSQCGSLIDVPCETVSIKTDHQVAQTQLYMKGICSNCLTSKN